MNEKAIFPYLVIIAVLLIVLTLLLVLVIVAGIPRLSDTAAPVPETEPPVPTEATQEPVPEEPQAPSQEPIQEETTEPSTVSEEQLRIDSQPITDEETVLRLSAYAEDIGAATQVLYVLAEGSTARVSLQEKGSDGQWHTTCMANGWVGKNGVGEVFEGSGKTPQGVYSLSTAFGIKEDPGALLPYTQVDSSHYWVDDPDSVWYNQFVTTNEVEKDWNSAEHLIDYQPAYFYAIAIDYNLACIPGAGSAFFVHCSSGRATLGCVSVSEEDMRFFLQTIGENACIVIENSGNPAA